MTDQEQAKVAPETNPIVPPKKSKRFLWIAPLVIMFIGFGIWAINYIFIGLPVEKELKTDSRNNTFSLSAHFQYYIDPTTLVLNLGDVQAAAPADLYRGLFQSAMALQKGNCRFEKVVLARSGKPVFVMDGKEFYSTGAEYGAGQNPVYLIRTMPEKLYKPDGSPAFGTWTGGWIGVLGKQIEDANEAARQWGMG